MGIFLSTLLCDVKCKLSSSSFSPNFCKIQNNYLCFVHWICDSELVLPEDQCERKKLKTKTEAARGGCHMDLILTKDRQRESEMKGGGIKQSFLQCCGIAYQPTLIFFQNGRFLHNMWFYFIFFNLDISNRLSREHNLHEIGYVVIQ